MSTSTQQTLRRVHLPRARAVRLLVALVLAAAVVAVAVLVGRAAFSESAETARPDLQRILDGLVTGDGRLAPGATAYVSGPEGTWIGPAGVADLTTGEPMPADARMRLESVSKIYTAALVLQLAQDGRLRVDDTVERWLPGMLPYGSQITVRQLLTMRSGLIDNNDLISSEAASRRYLARVQDAKLRAQLVATAERITANPAGEVSPVLWIRYAAWQPLLFEPGQGFHYSNIGYDLLGLIAVRAGGEALPTLYRERIFEPLRLEDTAYDPQGPIAGQHATGYAFERGSEPLDTSDFHFGVGADGGIVSNAEDTATFLMALMDGALLDEEQLADMQGENLWLGGDFSGCAGRAYGWSGGGDGYKTNVWVSGDGIRVAVLLLNARGGAQADRAAGVAMQRLYCAG